MAGRVHVVKNNCVISSMNGKKYQSCKLKVSSQNYEAEVSWNPRNYNITLHLIFFYLVCNYLVTRATAYQVEVQNVKFF